MNLPETTTPEQFKKAEPILLTSILESDEAYSEGIMPLTPQDYRTVKPGHYEGQFCDKRRPKIRFSFVITVDDDGETKVTYSPINPELMAQVKAAGS